MSRICALVALASTLISSLFIAACQSNTQQLPYNGTYGFNVVLQNNPDAVDPSWEQVVAFLKSDLTDEMDYVEGDFMCGSFAQEVHNNAEKAGIRAAWVGIDLAREPVGHAVNAFNTTDRGLVFTDSTGRTALERKLELRKLEDGADGGASVTGDDRVAYVDKGRELGFISLSVNPSPDYTYYEKYRSKSRDFEAKVDGFNQKVEAYNAEVGEFNQWVHDRTFIVGSSEANRVAEWKGRLQMSLYLLKEEAAGLDKEKAELGPIWEPMGTISGIDIRW
ncbi:MAG: hypothetical protein WC541_03535 [Dehalococcoidia bacterium]